MIGIGTIDILISISLLLAALVDLHLVPGHIFGSLYAIPIMLAALSSRRRTVWAAIALATPLYLLGATYSAATFETWVFRLLGFSGVCALAIVWEGRRRETERHAREQQAIATAAQALAREHDLTRAGAVIADQAQNMVDAQAIELWEADHERQEWRLIAERGRATRVADRVRAVPFREAALFVQAVNDGDLVEIPRLGAMAAECQIARDIAEWEGVTSAQIQPLKDDGCPIGAVLYLHRRRRALSTHQRAMVQSIGSLWSVALTSARLFTEVAERAREAEEARQNLQRFVGMVAHDLRGPVTLARGYAQLLRAQPESSGPHRDRALSAIEKSTTQMTRLIDDLLVAAQIGAGSFAVRRGPVDLAALAREILEARKAAHQEDQPALPLKHRLLLDAPPILVGQWDGDRLRQLLTNLVTNAIKYSPQGGEVRVVVRVKDGHAEVGVSDQGPGIPLDEAGRLFDPFTRLDPKGSTRGAGLGLYISRGIVEAHQGRIWIDTHLGQGTTFWFTLPLANEVDLARLEPVVAPAADRSEPATEASSAPVDDAAASPRR